ncbi:PhoH family protein [Butyricicoccus faecihominis]|uniref:PhoH family protein n=1 Tax=Butyricicoccaceae TaxID=3085642 RepID=UPI00247A2609|nr:MULTISPECIES: PhoH family protein [Butyricicoccaceae]MCQ5129797.1 PhoH family protein [Butyricicoccus faecihominis]WNX83761.1 PhoH family protein [Agathobaculum sp. NTUH-O15-33]
MYKERIDLDVGTMQELFGVNDQNVKKLENELGVSLLTREGMVELSGEDVAAVKTAVETLRTLNRMGEQGETLGEFAVDRALDFVRTGSSDAAVEAMRDTIAVSYNGAPIKCRTVGQKKYVEALRNNTVTISIGPAGTGKTYLAVAVAVAALKAKKVAKIVLCRPAVEAGEKLGFLPGDLQNKVDPYLRPLYDALEELLGRDTMGRYLETGVIEIAPLAYMRGRTLKNSFVIADECQNMMLSSHIMILTRLGEGSKMVLTGDITQIDLPDPRDSGLRECAEILSGMDDIAVIRLSGGDVIRHKLVAQIVKAFEQHAAARKSTAPSKKPTHPALYTRHAKGK